MRIIFEIQTDEDKGEMRAFFRSIISKTQSAGVEKPADEKPVKKYRSRKPGSKNKPKTSFTK
jgi:hypothetical protein